MVVLLVFIGEKSLSKLVPQLPPFFLKRCDARRLQKTLPRKRKYKNDVIIYENASLKTKGHLENRGNHRKKSLLAAIESGRSFYFKLVCPAQGKISV